MKGIFLKKVRVLFLLAAVLLPAPACIVAQTWEERVEANMPCKWDEVQDIDEELLNAAARGVLDEVKYWILKGAYAWLPDRSGMTALHWAARNGHADVVVYLIEQEHLDANALANDNQTPLHVTVWNGHLEVVQYLVKNKISPAKVNLRDKSGETALHIAAEKGRLDIVQFLVENQVSPANVWIRNNAKETPWHYAKKFHQPEIATYLRAQMDKNPQVKVKKKLKKTYQEKTKKKKSKR